MNGVTTSPARFIGCDVGKKEIVVFDSLTRNVSSIANNREALARFAAGLDPDVLVICEATGGYEAMLLEALAAHGRPAHRADARKVKAFIRSFGTLGKNDSIDARALTRYGAERHLKLPRWKPADKDQSALARLVLTRLDLIKDRTAWSNRSKAPGSPAEIIAPLLAALNEQIRAVEARIKALLDACHTLRERVAVVRTIKGLGPTVAPELIALMPELGSLDRRRIASLAGLAPHPNQSGTRDGYRKVRGGRAAIKPLLLLPAMTAARHDPKLKPFYDRLIADGKKPIVALVAVMRKMIIIANARLRDAAPQQLS